MVRSVVIFFFKQSVFKLLSEIYSEILIQNSSPDKTIFT